MQHCTDLLRQVTFPVHTEQGKMGPGWGERYRSSREGEEWETKEGKRRIGEEKKRKQATDFEEAVCSPTAVVQGAT